jgi:hypothetical protein
MIALAIVISTVVVIIIGFSRVSPSKKNANRNLIRQVLVAVHSETSITLIIE